jgi:DNA-binding LacI/PurR family transcriptional regulator
MLLLLMILNKGKMMEKNLCIPIYMQIVEDIKSKIKSLELKPGTVLPKELQVAEDYNVSRSTIRNAFAILEKQGFIHRKKSKGTIIANNALHNKHLKADLAIITNFGTEDISNYVDLMTNTLECGYMIRNAAKLKLLFRVIPWHEGEKLFSVDEILFSKGIDGFICPAPLYAKDILARIAKERIPHICFESHFDHPGINTIMADDEKATYDAMEKLAQLGHREIGFLGGLLKSEIYNSGIRRRYNTFKSSLSTFSLESRNEWIVNSCENAYHVDFKDLAFKLLNRSDRPTAVVSALGFGAEALLEAAATLKINVPEELSIICIDCSAGNTGNLSPQTNRRISGFCRNPQKISQVGLQSLLQWIKDPTFKPRLTKISYDVRIGDTLGDNRQ